MKNKTWQYISYMVVIASIAIAIMVTPKTITGSSQIQFQEQSRYAKTLQNWIHEFYDINGIIFPKGSCTETAKGLLENCLTKRLQVTEDFTTTGPQRVSSLMFGIEQEFVGVAEMIYGKDLVDKENCDTVLNYWVEEVVRLPKLSRASEIEATFYGSIVDNQFYVKNGKFTTPMIECFFEARPDGSSDCTCKTGRRHEYVNE